MTYSHQSMTRKSHFVSFGAGRPCYRAALGRLRKEITDFDSQATLWFFDEEIATIQIAELGETLRDFASRYPRGFGLWIWKPWILKRVLLEVNDGDYVFYLDAGCSVHTSVASRARFDWYLDYLSQHTFLFFQQPYLERNWSKKEVIDHFLLNEKQRASGQALGTIQGYLASEKSRQFVDQWLSACSMNSGRFLQDVNDVELEDGVFIEHRHDQSVFSCLAKSRNVPMLKDETFHHPKWNRDGDGYPIWATRKCSGLPSWMGYYAPRAWPWVIKSRLLRKPLTPLLDPEVFPRD